MSEILIVISMLTGSFFCFTASLGVLRFSDVMCRQHASAKAGTLGVGLILFAVALHFNDLSTTTLCIATLVFLMITAPVAAHLIGKAVYHSGLMKSCLSLIYRNQSGE